MNLTPVCWQLGCLSDVASITNQQNRHFIFTEAHSKFANTTLAREKASAEKRGLAKLV